jgi:RNA polymerase sigma-70 factor (ECF subfamily)
VSQYTVAEAADFDRLYPVNQRIAAARARITVIRFRLPWDYRIDLEQDALLELWEKQDTYDPHRASWRTYGERVAANKLASTASRLRSRVAAQCEDLDHLADRPAPRSAIELRIDIRTVLSRLRPFDRAVANSLLSYSVTEICTKLGVSRATVYRAIARLRVAFEAAGITSRFGRRKRKVCR